MILNLLFTEPMIFVAWLLAIILSLTIHEYAHAFAAEKQGDPTPRLMGRLTLNPLSHIDSFGLLSLLLVGFGWGKPVPINPLNFKNKEKGDIIVSLAGPISNFLMVILFGFILRIFFLYSNFTLNNLMVQFLFFLVMINVVLGIFNLIPIPPLDGSHILFNVLPSTWNEFKYKLHRNGPFILMMVILMDRFLGIGFLSGLFNFFISAVQKIVFM